LQKELSSKKELPWPEAIVVCCEDDSSERNAANIVIHGSAQISVTTLKERRHDFFFS
jgi:hypothetical protein